MNPELEGILQKALGGTRLSEDDARSLLVRGFVNEVIDTIKCDPLRAHIGDLVTARLQEL